MIFTLKFGDYTFPNQTFEIVAFPIINTARERPIVRKHGAVIQTPFLKSKKFRIKGIIHNADKAISRSQLDDMQAALLVGEEYFQEKSGREIKAYTRKFNPEPEEGSDKAIYNVTIDLIAQNPFFMSTGATISDTLSFGDGLSAFDIFVGGKAFTEPQIYVYADGGTIIDDFSLVNITNNNQLMSFRGTILNGQTLEIDSERLRVLNNSADGISHFEGDFINLLPGTNSFQFDGMTCDVVISRKNRWYG